VQERKTALIFACASGCGEVVQLLLDSRANINAKDKVRMMSQRIDFSDLLSSARNLRIRISVSVTGKTLF
jgi:ankyrin repeat protein